MKRRELLKFLPALGGAVFVGELDQYRTQGGPSKHHPKRGVQYRIVAYGLGGWQSTNVDVYDHETGDLMPWGVVRIEYCLTVGDTPRMHIRYVTDDKKTGAIEMTQHGFLMEHRIEGSVV